MALEIIYSLMTDKWELLLLIKYQSSSSHYPDPLYLGGPIGLAITKEWCLSLRGKAFKNYCNTLPHMMVIYGFGEGTSHLLTDFIYYCFPIFHISPALLACWLLFECTRYKSVLVLFAYILPISWHTLPKTYAWIPPHLYLIFP